MLGTATFESRLDEGRLLKTTEEVLGYINAAARSQPALEVPSLARLSTRERQLIVLVAQGRTDAQIATELYISVRTVRSHLDRIRDKSGCRRRADLTRLAIEAGHIDRPLRSAHTSAREQEEMLERQSHDLRHDQEPCSIAVDSARRAPALEGARPTRAAAAAASHPFAGCDSSVPSLVEAVTGLPWLSKAMVTVCSQIDPSE